MSRTNFYLFRFHQPHAPCEELHHPLFDGESFVPTLFQYGDLSIHIGEDSGDGAVRQFCL